MKFKGIIILSFLSIGALLAQIEKQERLDLSGVEFKNRNSQGFNFSYTKSTNGLLSSNVNFKASTFLRIQHSKSKFTDCNLDNTKWRSSTVENGEFKGGSLKNAMFTGSRLQGTKFHTIDLTGCYFDYCDLRGASFTNVTGLETISWHHANISGALFEDSRFPALALTKGALQEPDRTKWLTTLTNDSPLIYFEIFEEP